MFNLSEIILTVPVFLLAISCHEYAHAWAAVRLGDPTPRYQGRLTLNFMAHLSLLGALFLLIAGIGWAKPVQVNTRNLRHPVRDMFWISLAGPAANLALAVAFALLLQWAYPFIPGGRAARVLLLIGVRLNLLLTFFNLLPIPPLDGAKVLAPVLPTRWVYALERLEPWGFLIIYALFNHLGVGQLLYFLTDYGMWLLL